MKILFTGASGFLGRALIPLLLQRGHTVYGLFRKPPKNIPSSLVPIFGDITKPNLLENMRPIDTVIHSAALLSFSAKDKEELYDTNYQGTVNLLEWMRRYKIRRLFHISTAYLFKQNHYEISKEMAEEAISRYPEIGTTIFRPSIIIGDSQVQGLPPLSGFYSGIMAVDHVKRWFEQKAKAHPLRAKIRICGKPSGRLNLIPVDIVVENMIAIITEDKRGIFYLTHPDPPTLEAVERPISEAIGADIKFTPKFKPNLLERAVSLSLKELSPYLKGHELPSDIKCPSLNGDFLARSIKKFLNT